MGRGGNLRVGIYLHCYMLHISSDPRILDVLKQRFSSLFFVPATRELREAIL